MNLQIPKAILIHDLNFSNSQEFDNNKGIKEKFSGTKKFLSNNELLNKTRGEKKIVRTKKNKLFQHEKNIS